MRYLVVLVLLFASVNLTAKEGHLKETSFDVVKPLIGKGKVIFLEVGSDTCIPCQKMGKLLYQAKQQHPTYSLYFVNVRKGREAAEQLKVMVIPTQIILDANGDELYRHMGLLSQEELDGLFKKYKF